MSKIDVWAKRLASGNPEARLKAIDALEMLGEAEALPILAEVFVNDPEPQVRQAAQKTGKIIYYNLHRQAEVTTAASEEERRRAAEILAQARARKQL